MAVLHEGDREDARHPVPFWSTGSKAMDFVVGDRDRLADSVAHRTCLAFETGSQHHQRHVGRLAHRGLSADAVDHGEDTSCHVHVEPVFVDLALETGVREAGGRDRVR